MSQADLARFADRVLHDQALHAQLEALGVNAEAWRARAAELGFGLTLNEAHALAESMLELSDEELEDVAGGWTGGDPPPPSGGG